MSWNLLRTAFKDQHSYSESQTQTPKSELSSLKTNKQIKKPTVCVVTHLDKHCKDPVRLRTEMPMSMILKWRPRLSEWDPHSHSVLPTYKNCRSSLPVAGFSAILSILARGRSQRASLHCAQGKIFRALSCLSTACEMCQLSSCETQTAPMIQLKTGP